MKKILLGTVLLMSSIPLIAMEITKKAPITSDKCEEQAVKLQFIGSQDVREVPVRLIKLVGSVYVHDYPEGSTPLRVSLPHWKILDPQLEGLYALTQNPSDYVNSVIELEDGRLTSCSDDGTVRIWDSQPVLSQGDTDVGYTAVELRDGRFAPCCLNERGAVLFVKLTILLSKIHIWLNRSIKR